MRPFRSFQRRSRSYGTYCLALAQFPNRAWEQIVLQQRRHVRRVTYEIVSQSEDPTQTRPCPHRPVRCTRASRQRKRQPRISSCPVKSCTPMSDSTSCRAIPSLNSNISIIPPRDAIYTSPRARRLIRKHTYARARRLAPERPATRKTAHAPA